MSIYIDRVRLKYFDIDRYKLKQVDINRLKLVQFDIDRYGKKRSTHVSVQIDSDWYSLMQVDKD